jgi:nitrogen regulatory protein P-II 1
LAHLPGFTVFPAHGHPRGQGPTILRPHRWNPDAHDRLIHVLPGRAEQVVEAIRAAAHTGHPGDGLIAVSELADALRIRSGENAAL